MTESEWLTCGTARELLLAVTPLARGKGPREIGDLLSRRKLRLLGCACGWQVWGVLTDARSQRAVEVAERHADNEAGQAEMALARSDADESLQALPAREMAERYARWAMKWLTRDELYILELLSDCKSAGQTSASQVALVHDIVGDPFRPHEMEWGEHHERPWSADASDRLLYRLVKREMVAQKGGAPFPSEEWLAVDWLTATVVGLARAAYEERAEKGVLDAVRLGILADALEESGCESVELLSHLRGPGPHVRGCWAVDLLLGRV